MGSVPVRKARPGLCGIARALLIVGLLWVTSGQYTMAKQTQDSPSQETGDATQESAAKQVTGKDSAGEKSAGKKSAGKKSAGKKSAGKESTEKSQQSSGSMFNLKLKTLGGMQFWTDVLHRSGWRIQRNTTTGHFRLIDDRDIRHAWGSHADCLTAFEKQVRDKRIAAHRGHVVIVLHGLMRSRRSMDKTVAYLKKHANFEVINFEYSSTREKVGDHAKALKQVIDQLGPSVTRIDFVAHSLGNLVVRHYLRDTENPRSRVQGDPRIGRIVMLGPPNQGSQFARILKSSLIFKTLAGASGAQLANGWQTLAPHLATPRCEFGIIAGAQESDRKLSNFVLSGRDDFTVRLKETMLVGARDWYVKPFFHSTIMSNPDALQAMLNFLNHGYFVSESQRIPIESLKQKYDDIRGTNANGQPRK